MIYFRTDGNETIGLGHVMRCLSVAIQIEKKGENVLFLLSDSACSDLLEKRDVKYYVLGTNFDKSEIALMNTLIKEVPGKVIVDSYVASKEYLEALHELTWVAFMDDLNKFDATVDMVINYNIYACDMQYRKVPDRICLLGADYAPIREEFKRYPIADKCKHPKTVLISTGGSDSENIAGKFIDKALEKDSEIADFTFHVVSGKLNQNVKVLKEYADRYDNVILYEDVQNMAELMSKCELAVTAGGSTMYEMCAMGLPMICFSMADNQRMQVKKAEELGFAVNVGDYATDGEKIFTIMCRKIKELHEDTLTWWEMQNAGWKTVMGNGASEIAMRVTEIE